jgi:D-3-phosphoglycerate dehydrogenase
MTEAVRVLIADKMDPKAAAIFRERGIEVDGKPGLTPDELAAIIGDYDGLAVRSSTKVNAAIMDAGLPRLKVIGRAGIGVDTIDVPAASARGIVVMNTPFGNSITTAEHAIAMLFALAREIPQADQSTQSGKWEKNRFMGVELAGQDAWADRLRQYRFDRRRPGARPQDEGRRLRPVPVARARGGAWGRESGAGRVARPSRLHHPAHAADRPDPRNLEPRGAGQDEGRGAHRQLRARRPHRRGGAEGGAGERPCRGAALDVFQEEPAKDNALFGTRGLICTPHLGASTTEAQVNVAIQIAEQMSDYLLLGGITNAVNVPSLSAEEAPRLRPYMALAEKLGRLVGQIAGTEIRSIDVEVEGAAAELNIKPITGAVLAGVMRSWSDTVNMVNAPYLAKERGLAVREIRNEGEGDYHTLVAVTVGTEHGPRRLKAPCSATVRRGSSRSSISRSSRSSPAK